MRYAAMLALGAVLGLAAPGLALAACERPTPPAPVDGKTATLEQILAAKSSVAGFMTASDAYQACLMDEVAAQRAAAKAAKTSFDPAIAKAADARVDENQSDKERAGAAYNAAAKAYKATHPS
jgi:hypothetical protein